MLERLADKVSRHLSRMIVTARVPLRLDRPVVAFSFDDVPESAATLGASLLEERGVRGSFYVCGGLAGQDWVGYRLAGLDRIAELSARGHEIGCHTAHHLRVTEVGTVELLRDVALNARILEPLVGKLASFAYPYGAIGLRAKQALQSRFGVCRGIHGAMAVGFFDRGRLDATALDVTRIDRRGIDALLDAAVAKRGWLTFYTHDVREEPSGFGITPGLLAYAIDGALARGCRIETVGNVVAQACRDADSAFTGKTAM